MSGARLLVCLCMVAVGCRCDRANDISSGPAVLLGNRVVYKFDESSGALLSMHGAGGAVEIPAGAVSPVRIWLGDASNPDVTEARVAVGQQKLTSSTGTFDGIELMWDDLLDIEGRPTGVSLTLRATVPEGQDFAVFGASVVNRGDYLVTGMAFGVDRLALSADAASETLSVPCLMGFQQPAPRKDLAGQRLIGLIPSSVPAKWGAGSGGMYAAWYDLSTASFGVGTGYLNRRGMDMVGEAAFAADGASLMWRLFRLEGAWRFMHPIKGESMIYPLARGESFVSDPWFIGLHEGDWHATARFYRKQYEQVFAGDFLRWQDVAPAVRDVDVVLNSTAAWGVKSEDGKTMDMSKGQVRGTFLSFPQRVRERIAAMKIDPKHCLFVMIGQGTHWGIYKLPDYFPVCAEAGGPDDFREMIRQLREEIGVAGTHFYAHAAFNHPDADNYVAEADTGWSANLFHNFDHLGRIACMDSAGWFALWRDKLIPGFVEAGASGIEFDEGFGHHFICDQPGHLHSQSAESVLTAQPRGALRIFREARRQLGANGYLECEGGGDVGARLIDIWEHGGTAGPIELVRYTHPDKVVVVFPVKAPDDYARAFVYGMPVLHHTQQEEVTEPLVQYVANRRAIRDAKAPGYPYGFCDDDGLRRGVDGVAAKVYRDEGGVTLVYYAEKAAKGVLVVDCAALGHAALGVREHAVALEPFEAGFVVFR